LTKFIIEKVIDETTKYEISETLYKDLFKISNDGVFELLEFNKEYKNYLVFINTFNTAIWS